MTENTQAAAPRLACHPATGELVNLDDVTTANLVRAIEATRELARDLRTYEDDLVAEVARRLDRGNSRTLELEDADEAFRLETNAPVEDTYAVDPTRAAIERLIRAEVLDVDVLHRVIVYPPRPPAPAPRVDKREVNKLKAHDDARVARALGEARERRPNRRTLKITRLDRKAP